MISTQVRRLSGGFHTYSGGSPLFRVASRHGGRRGGQSLNNHPNAPFQLRRDSILALQILLRALQVRRMHHVQVRVVASLGVQSLAKPASASCAAAGTFYLALDQGLQRNLTKYG